MRSLKVAVVVGYLALPAALVAQQLPAETTSAAVGSAALNHDEEENPRLELLGLLGLVGLLGLFRREPNIHIDARRTPRLKKVRGDSSAR